jgi:hypothetical protein
VIVLLLPQGRIQGQYKYMTQQDISIKSSGMWCTRVTLDGRRRHDALGENERNGVHRNSVHESIFG